MITAADQQEQISYTALSDAARKSGQLSLYDNVSLNTACVNLGRYTLEVSMPKKTRAYDVIPIRYKLSQPAGNRRAAVEAVAFEDIRKSKGAALYDLAIPGNMGMKLELLGSIGAEFLDDEYIPLTADPKTPVSPYPPFKRSRFSTSSTIKPANAVWFKFRITNTGDTIFDPEGIGATLAAPVLTKYAEDGSEEWCAKPVNLFERQLEYIYPGESVDVWVNFWCPALDEKHRNGLTEGKYKIRFSMLYKYYREYDWMVNIWDGAEFARLEAPITVSAKPIKTPITAVFTVTDSEEKMPGFIDYFEEFMTTFRIHQPKTISTVKEETLYLQIAPWTKEVVIKLILTDPKEIAVVRIPVKVSMETLDVQYNPSNIMIVEENGVEMPAFVAMAMPCMRAGFQLGPYPEQIMEKDIREMKALGVNVIVNTAGGWWISEISGRKGVELFSAQYKYWYDVLMRKHGMKCLGWSVYPPSGTGYVNGHCYIINSMNSGGLDKRATVSLPVELKAGSNIIRFANPASAAPDIDKFELIPDGGTVEKDNFDIEYTEDTSSDMPQISTTDQTNEHWFYIMFSDASGVIQDMGNNTDLMTKGLNTGNTSQMWKLIINNKSTNSYKYFIVNKNGHGMTNVASTQTSDGIYQSTSDSSKWATFKIVSTTNSDFSPSFELERDGSNGRHVNQFGGAGYDHKISEWTANDHGDPLRFVPASSTNTVFSGSLSMKVNGVNRSTLIYVPSNIGNNRPLLISLHGRWGYRQRYEEYCQI